MADRPSGAPAAVPADPAIAEGELAPLENRLTPESIAALDEMNKSFFTRAAGGDPSQPEPAGSPAAPAANPPKPPASAEPPAAPPPPSGIRPDVLPPDDAPPVADKEPGDAPPKAGEEFPEGKSILSDETIGKFRTEKQKHDITTLRDNYDKIRPALEAANQKIAELEAKVSAPNSDLEASLADLKARNEQLNQIVEKYAIKEHPWVQKEFTGPRDVQIKRAEKAMEMANLPTEDLRRALGLPEKERIAALDDIYGRIESPTIKGNLEKAIAQIETLDERYEAFLADRKGNMARLEQEEATQRRERTEAQTKAYATAIDKTFEYFAETVKNPFFRRGKDETHAKWNEGLDKDLAEAKEFALHNEDPAKLLAVVAMAARAGRAFEAYSAAMQMVKERDATIARLQGSNPSLTAGAPPAAAAEPTQITPGMSLVEAGKVAVRQVQAAGGA